MNIITVAPIEKGIFKEELSYFSKAKIAPGALVSVPVRNRVVPALCLRVENVGNIKSSLKSSDFSLKKVSAVLHPSLFRPDFIAAAEKTKDYFITTLGQVIRSATPKIILESLATTKWPQVKTDIPSRSSPTGIIIEKLALQDSPAERLSFYRSLIRETFARGQSVLVITPTAIEAEKLFPLLGKGIEPYTIVLHSKKPSDEILDHWQKALTDDHPELIIATPLYLSYPKHNLGAIIIEDEGDDDYLPVARPFIDPRRLAESYAEAGRHKFIVSDTSLRTETIHRLEQRDLLPASPIKYRFLPETTISIIDMKSGVKESSEKNRPFTILSPEVIIALERGSTKKKNSFLLVGRRGLAPITVCNDCDNLITCPTCSGPLTLHEKKSRGRIFVCHQCGQTEKSIDRCPLCESWRLSILGIGTETVGEFLTKLYPELAVFIIDSDYCPTPGKALKIMNNFLSTPGAILIGTEMALRYFIEPVHFTSIVTIDHMFTLPGFRTQERLMRLLLEVKEKAKEKTIIQTRLISEPIWQQFASGNLLEFYRQEIRDRQEADYPPFSILVKITRIGANENVERDLSRLARLLDKFNPVVYPAYTPSPRGKYTAHVLLKVPAAIWAEGELKDVLRALPPLYIINVEPADIL